MTGPNETMPAARPVPRPAVLATFAALVALHLYFARDMVLPIILGDEFGYFANAAFFAGFDWSGVLVNVNYYSFGYSLLLTPLFWLFEDPYLIYRSALAINAVATAAILFPALYVARRLAPETGRWTRLAVAVASCLYPSYVVYANLAWAESLFALVFWLLAALFCHLQDDGAPAWRAGLAALGVSYLYVVHPRGLTVVAAAALVVVVATLAAAWPRRRAAWFFSVLVPALAAAELTRHLLLQRLWLGKVTENTFASVGDKVGNVFSLSGLSRLPLETLGQCFYLAMASYGLVVVGLVVVGRRAWRPGAGVGRSGWAERLRHGVRWDAAFLVVAFALSFALSVGFQLKAARADQWIYGRYNEGVAGPFILLGLAALTLRGRGFRTRGALLLGSLAALALLAVTSGLQEVIAAAEPGVIANTSGLFPYRAESRWSFDLLVVSANAVATALVLLAALRLRREIGVALTAGVFVWVASSNVDGLYARAAELRGEAVEIHRWLDEHDPPSETVQFVMTMASDRCSVYRWIYQFLLPDRAVLPVRHPRRDLARGGPALAITCDGHDLRETLPRARPLAHESEPPLTLWVLNSGLRGPGRASEEPEAYRLPPTGYRSHLSSDDLPAALDVDRDLERWFHRLTRPRILHGLRETRLHLDVEVTNASAFDWPQDVRVGVVWYDAEGEVVTEYRGDLQGTLASGESQVVTVPLLEPFDPLLSELPPGEYTVRIGMLQEHVAWFSSQGDATLGFPATLH